MSAFQTHVCACAMARLPRPRCRRTCVPALWRGCHVRVADARVCLRYMARLPRPRCRRTCVPAPWPCRSSTARGASHARPGLANLTRETSVGMSSRRPGIQLSKIARLSSLLAAPRASAGEAQLHTVGVAQLVRAPGCGPGGREFNSRRSPQFSVTRDALAHSVTHK
jgi:hypothetical protein